MGIYLGKASLAYLKTKISKMILARELKWNDITGKPSVYPPATHTHVVATTTADGFISKTDKSKLNSIADGANRYMHPTYTTKTLGLYKISVDGLGHISSVAAVTKTDITSLGIPAKDTIYTHPSTHPSNMIVASIEGTTISLSEILACAVFPIAQDSSSVTLGNINEWLAAGKPRL